MPGCKDWAPGATKDAVLKRMVREAPKKLPPLLR
jgi:hypothetical protein